MKSIRFVWVGRLKTPFWREAATHYWNCLGRYWRLEELCVKDGDSRLPETGRVEREGERILDALRPGSACVALDERGEQYSSRELSSMLSSLLQDTSSPCFVIGGPFGLADAVLARCSRRLSLSRLTFPHELARVMLLEQLYRATTILKGSGYHHD